MHSRFLFPVFFCASCERLAAISFAGQPAASVAVWCTEVQLAGPLSSHLISARLCLCFFLFQALSASCSTEMRLQACSRFEKFNRLFYMRNKPCFEEVCLLPAPDSHPDLCPPLHSVLFQDDDPITGGADGRENIRVRKFLSERHKKVPWKPEVISPPFIRRFLRGFLQSLHHLL